MLEVPEMVKVDGNEMIREMKENMEDMLSKKVDALRVSKTFNAYCKTLNTASHCN